MEDISANIVNDATISVAPTSGKRGSSRKAVAVDAAAVVPKRARSAIKSRPDEAAVVAPPPATESHTDAVAKTPRQHKPEPLLTPNPRRYVLFPIEHPDVFAMYKRHQATEWKAEDMDLSRDLADWEKLTDNERHFIKHVLAFFAASDGIVMENLATRFSNEVQWPEARQYYAVQMKMEAVHCVAPETPILTDKGYFMIADLVGTHVNVWNGEEFSGVDVVQTSPAAKLLRVRLSNGMELQCTEKHKWFINGVGKVFTKDLKPGDIIEQYNLPVLDLKDETNSLNCSLASKIARLNALINTYGSILVNDHGDTTIIVTTNQPTARDFQLMLTTVGVHSIAKNGYLYIAPNGVNKLRPFGLVIPPDINLFDESIASTHRFKEMFSPVITIEEVIDWGISPTYCFTEPKRHAGTFAGIVTGQSETYSLLIDEYIKDVTEKAHIFNAIETIPCIAKKAKWAMQWIVDKDADFATRLLAFAIVEGIFFSGAFCAIYWLKERGLMPGLTASNEWIARDEALHTEFACVLYSHLRRHVSKSTVFKIFRQALKIEKEFICDALPCSLIGMKAESMCQYLEFVADRLLVQLGYPKLYEATNPFDFMDRISIEGKTNFFEKRVTSYSVAGVDADGAAPKKVIITSTEDF